MLTDIADIQGRCLRGDILIIGAGAIGITLALELERSGLTVYLLESGGRKFEQETQALYDSDVTGMPHGGIHNMRFRLLGGSTTRWAGQALPLFEMDFAHRDWIPSSGWPITRADLEPYYDRARHYLGIPPFSVEPGQANGSLCQGRYSQFSPAPDFALRWGYDLARASNVTVVLHANVREILFSKAEGCVHGAVARSLDGVDTEFRASAVVIACGGIESARILLASDSEVEGGLGNRHDLVGRCFQDHPACFVGEIHPRKKRELARRWASTKVGGVKHQFYLTATAEYQREKEMPHYSASVVYPQTNIPGMEAAKRLFKALVRREYQGGLTKDFLQCMRSPLAPARAAVRHFFANQSALDTDITPVMGIAGEQIPNPKSCVTLSGQVDRLGMKKTRLNWELTAFDLSRLQTWGQDMAGYLERQYDVSIDLDDFTRAANSGDLKGRVFDQGHHIGTLRMAETAECGVVSPSCEVYGCMNLFVASSAVFPTGGFSNPTYTAMALAIRCGDEIARRLSSQ